MPSNSLTVKNIQQYLSTESLKKLNEYKQSLEVNIKATLDEKFNLLNDTLKEGPLKGLLKEMFDSQIKKLTQNEISKFAKDRFKSHVPDFRNKQFGEMQFWFFNDPSLDVKTMAALKSYARTAWNKRHDLDATQIWKASSKDEAKEKFIAYIRLIESRLHQYIIENSHYTNCNSVPESFEMTIDNNKITYNDCLLLNSYRTLIENNKIKPNNVPIIQVFDYLALLLGLKGNHAPHSASDYCVEKECQDFIKEMLQNKFKTLTEEISNFPEAVEELTEKWVTICRSTLARKLLGSQNNENFRKKIIDVLPVFVEKGMRNYSKQSKESFISFVENKVEWLSTNDSHSSEKADKFTESLNNKNIYLDFFSIDVFTNPQDHLKEICNDGNNAKIVGDRVETHWENGDLTATKLIISPYSCQHFSYGKNIIAHELGHLLGHFFKRSGEMSTSSSDQFLALRACANQTYKQPREEANPSDPKYIDGDFHTTEEDNADLLASLTYDHDTTFQACAYFEQSTDGKNYKLSPLIDVQFNHSSNLLRILQSAIHRKNHIPSSCQKIINNSQHLFSYIPCF